MRLVPCISSSLVGVAWEVGDEDFYIKFKDGSVYKYVTESYDFAAVSVANVLFAESQGRMFKVVTEGLEYHKLSPSEEAELELHV